MLTIPGITVQTQIYESANSLVYRGIRESDHQRIILKILKENYPTPYELARYRTEYQITQSLNVPGVVKVYDLQTYQNTLVMFLEDFGAESLKHWINQRPFSLEEFFAIAIAATEALGQIHAANLIHKDINPSNILFNPTTGQIKIIDFGISTQLTRENTTLQSPNGLEGTLPYLSPEQTGRMNRCLDYRTDFYSFGVTFYELLTHRLPFETTDALELVHCHIAKQPIPPTDIDAKIPPVLSEIVLKLMAKTAEDRYQNAYGLKADLEECLRQYNANNLLDFPLGRHDVSNKFQLPQKLYGRESEIQNLLSAFSESSTASQLMLIAGYSGIGKSALVQELYKPITEKRGYFISGKFDQLQRNIPYSAIVSAFQGLVKQLLTESKAQLNQWRNNLLAAVGVNGRVIVEVIPEIELIIGPQPEIPELGPNESQNRFNLVFQNFIKVFTQPQHPLALFIDDLQWADGASLKLMQLLMAGRSPGLFLIGAYRDNEVSAAHPLMLTLDEIAKTGAVIQRISLAPLDLETIAQLIGDTLNSDLQTVRSLAELVQAKTGGNPFFMNEFLKSLYTEKLVDFDRQTRQWQWDLEPIQARSFTDNVVELMVGKIQKLPEETQELLKIAACIGNEFDLESLGLILSKKSEELANHLYAAVAENLLNPLGNIGDIALVVAEAEFLSMALPRNSVKSLPYKFVHDRVQQAAYFLIEDSQKSQFHQKIGQIMLENTPEDKREEKIFDIVNQLNLGSALIAEHSAQPELAQLNLMAGKKAKLSTAYQPALNYLQIGIEQLPPNSWQQQYPLTLSLYEEAAEVAYLSGDLALMDQFVATVLSQAKTVLDKVKVYEVKILAYNAQGLFAEAIAIGLEVLNLLGIKLPKQANKLDVLRGLLATKLTIGRRAIASFIDLPTMTDPSSQAAMRIIAKISSAAYMAEPFLLPLIVFKQVSLSLKWGNASESAFAYSSYGLILCSVAEDFPGSSQFGQLALQLLYKLNAREVEARTQYVIYHFIQHWIAPVKEVLNPLRQAYAVGLETGDLEFGTYAALQYSGYALLSGSELVQLESEMATYTQVMEEMGQERNLAMQSLYHQAVLNLIEEGENPGILMGRALDEQVMLSMIKSRNDRTAISSLYFLKLMLSYLFNERENALAFAEVAEEYLDGITAILLVAHFYFYDSLARLLVATDASPTQKKALLQKASRNQKKIKKWMHYAPQNNSQKYWLVEAELCRVQGQDAKAMDYYDKAINLAKQNEYIHEAAIAYELAAKFYLSRGKELTAKAYMQEARYCYQRWGAVAKVKHLEENYGDLLTTTHGKVSSSQMANAQTTTGSGSNLDIATVTKSYQAISGEIMLDKLLSSLMKIILENAGAQRGYLILCHQGELRIEAESHIDEEQITVLQARLITDCSLISEAIVNYVARSQEAVVLNDATQEGNFTSDAYIQTHQPKSILCVPLINQGTLLSLIYLENNLTTGAFTPERVELLKLLSGQAAISIQNAKLYTEVRENESRLNQFLEAMPVGVGILDASGKPYYINRIAQELLGKGVMADTKDISEVYQLYKAGTEEEYILTELPLVRALQGETSIADDIEIHQNGKIIPLEGVGQPIYDSQGNIAYAITAFQDITERKRAEAERERFTNELFQLNQAYERFVPNQFLQFLEKSSIVDVELGDQVQLEMSVLFSDIRDFTTLSESMTPEDNFKFINAYLSRMEPAITEHSGFIDKYIGDAIMALFSGEADNAVKAAISMLHRLGDYNQHRIQQGFAPIKNGIGINTGLLMLGTVGGQNRMDGTVISDAVNLASRVEGLTKNYGVALLITDQTYARLMQRESYAIRRIEQVKVKGKSEAVTVYEVFDADSEEMKAGKLATLGRFTEALSLYDAGKFLEAAQLFGDCVTQNPGDRVAQIYGDRAQQKHHP
ncbi:AAA family ATPase [Oscillatoria acuminata]|uniref:PAS domain S-box n=1 Tax=Oscillatoria acuminata PCC 6304 TaxID=56110 RepID=K9TG95_9CYAN|nr:AAA family ATPase [Oscillatoria acuminata]AFY81872.1 PAS domain S-box [Oscillatoria acuminata PCC 6304]